MKKIPIVELFLSIVSLWLAVVMFFNSNIFSTMPKVFRIFSMIMDEKSWGLVFITAALMKIIGVVYMKEWLRKAGLTVSFMIYGSLSAGFLLGGEPIVFSTGTYFAMCVLAMYSIREVRERA